MKKTAQEPPAVNGGYTAAELSEWVSTPWKNADEQFRTLENLTIGHDTRTLKKGDLYIALKGENHDGHRFVEQAVEKGAAGLIIERGCSASAGAATDRPPLAIPQLVVPDTMNALWQLAAGARSTWDGTVIGITGSAGKTTVKDLLASVLAQKGSVAKTRGNWNNDIGLPLSMLAADRRARFFVFELGMNHPGEIDRLASLLRPDWALITTIGKAHIGFFQSLENIADEKAAILNHAANAVFDAGSEWFARLQSGFKGNVVTLTQQAFASPQPGEYMMQNTRFAATVGLELGLSVAEVQAGLNAFAPAPMRWQTIKKDNVLFINDAYNANPLSMRAALSAFAELPCTGNRIAVLGGMHELGAQSKTEHAELTLFAKNLNLDCVVFVGDLWNSGIKKSDAVALLREKIQTGDRVLLKASRGERLETILDEL